MKCEFIVSHKPNLRTYSQHFNYTDLMLLFILGHFQFNVLNLFS